MLTKIFHMGIGLDISIQSKNGLLSEDKPNVTYGTKETLKFLE